VAEALCLLAMWSQPAGGSWSLTLSLAMVMLPYVVLIATAAVAAAMLRGLGEFQTPALLPLWLNVCWLASIWLVVPRFASDPARQAHVMAWAVLLAGVVQIVAQWPSLRRHGWHWQRSGISKQDAPAARLIGPTVLAMTGLMAPQANALVDGLTAWLLSGPGAPYPLAPGAAAATYLGERLLMFPVGLIGVTVAMVVYPTLSRHSARRQAELLFDQLVASLRLVLLMAVPATFGLVLLAVPLTRLLFQRGDFTAGDTIRTAAMIQAYAVGVWAQSMLPVVVRGFYAARQFNMPVLVGVAAMITNAIVNVVLVFAVDETGLGLATSLSAAMHVAVLLGLTPRVLQQRAQTMRPLAATGLKSALASALMCLAGWAALRLMPLLQLPFSDVTTVVVPLAVCLATYFVVAAILMPDELRLLRDRRGA
jgi:putative peptidoglycan lipid II flippase